MAGEIPSPEESTDGLYALNDLLDSWSAEQVYVYTQTMDTFITVAGQASYSWGLGATGVTTVPPIRLLHGNALYQNVDMPVEIISLADWNLMADRNLTTGDIATKMYCDYAWPIANLNLYPVPKTSGGATIHLYSLKPLGNIASITTTFNLPPGYSRAIRFALGMDLTGEFGKPLTPAMLALAQGASDSLRKLNEETLRSLAMPPNPPVSQPQGNQ